MKSKRSMDEGKRTMDSSAQTHSLFSIPTWFIYAANRKAVYLSLVCASNSSSVFISASLAKLHNVPNASSLPRLAARCHALYPQSSPSVNNFSLAHLD